VIVLNSREALPAVVVPVRNMAPTGELGTRVFISLAGRSTPWIGFRESNVKTKVRCDSNYWRPAKPGRPRFRSDANK